MDSVDGFSSEELDTVYFFRLNKSDNSIVDSLCIINCGFESTGLYCSQQNILALPEDGYNYVLKTKTGYIYKISDILISATYSTDWCQCVKAVNRTVTISGVQHEINGKGDYLAPVIYLKKQ
jgi:hypothetical protein